MKPFRYVFAWNPTCHEILGRVHLRLMCSVDIFTVCFILVFNPTCLHFCVNSGTSWYFCYFEGCPAIFCAFGRWTSIFVEKWTVMNERMNFNSLKQLCENHTLITSRLEIDSFCTRVVFIIILLLLRTFSSFWLAWGQNHYWTARWPETCYLLLVPQNGCDLMRID